MVDHLSKERRSWNMSQIKGRDTVPERKLRSGLHQLGFRFRVHETRLPGKPDVVLPKYRTVIFVHGCFWHRHDDCRYVTLPKSNRSFWLEKFRGTVERDRRNITAFQTLGWKIYIAWECEIKADIDLTVRQIASHLWEVHHAT